MRQLRALIVAVLLAATTSVAAGGYTVRWGDTLTGIAHRLGVPTGSLAKANGITDANRVRAGSLLVVPASVPGGGGGAGTAGVFHVVAAGETLASIARRFSTTPAAIAAASRIADPDRIHVGDRLIIPGQRWLCPVRGFNTPVSNWAAPRPGHRSHQGNDIFAARGTPVVAPVGGVLRHVRGATAGYAAYLAGDDGTTYYFAHLDGYTAPPGRVVAGAVIGRVGNTGNAIVTPPHLHFEIHPGGGAPVDPWSVISRACR
jgi:LysM repeat protein